MRRLLVGNERLVLVAIELMHCLEGSQKVREIVYQELTQVVNQ